jgi:hypothetical protein
MGPTAPIDFMKSVLLTLFNIDPESIQLFPFKDEPDLAYCDSFTIHCTRLSEAVDKWIREHANSEELEALAKYLGKIH